MTCIFAESRLNAIVLDPPRCGLDAFTRRQLPRYDLVILISCDPETTLLRDIQELRVTHTIVSLALLDHFPGTAFYETAICLLRTARS